MDLNTFHSVSSILHSSTKNIADAKRPAYTIGSDDVLKNFKSVAERMGITPLQVWGVYFLKHVDAITSMAKDAAIPQAEAIEGRFSDALNYLDLGWALYQETRNRGVAAIPELDPIPVGLSELKPANLAEFFDKVCSTVADCERALGQNPHQEIDLLQRIRVIAAQAVQQQPEKPAFLKKIMD